MTRPAIVVAGDSLIDFEPIRLPAGDVAYRPHCGGSCLNVAIGLGRLDVPTAFLGRLSTDHFGRMLRAHLAEAGVGTDLILETDDLTTLAMVHLSEGGQPSYSFHASGAADRGLTRQHLTESSWGGTLPEGAALHIGSIALAMEPQASTLTELFLGEAGRRVLTLDPNVRPSLVTDHETFVSRIEALARVSTIVKCSDEDCAAIAPGAPPEQVMRRWLDGGVSLVVLTEGSKPVRAWTRHASAAYQPPPVPVIDTIGAGDSFMAALLADLHHTGRLSVAAIEALDDAALETILTWAGTAATHTVQQAGANPPWTTDLPAAT